LRKSLLPVLIAAIFANNAGAAQSQAAAGAIQTLAGPTFCPGKGARDDSTALVRSLAVAPDGGIFFDTGAARDAIAGKVLANGRSTVLPVGAARGADPSAQRAFDLPPGAGRLASDLQGGLLVAAGARILKLDQRGALAGVVGDPGAIPGNSGGLSAGDGGPVSGARFLSARSLANDDAGNLYIADQIDRRTLAVKIRFINWGQTPVTFYSGTPQQLVVAPGSIDTIAGRSGTTNAGDNGPAMGAVIAGTPPSLAVAAGRLYVGLYTQTKKAGASSLVRMINLTGDQMSAHGVSVGAGKIERVAGRGPEGFSGDKGPALSARFSFLPGIASDGKGSLFLADERHHRVRKVDPNGTINTIAGTGGTLLNSGGFNGNDRQAGKARLNLPYDVKIGPAGVYIADQGNLQVRTVDGLGVIRAAPGGGLGTSANCFPAGAPRPGRRTRTPTPIGGRPVSIETDAKGSIYFTIEGRNQIMRVTPSGLVSPIAGRDVSDPCSGRCRTFLGDGGPAHAARLSSPSALVIDQHGNVYFSDGDNNRVRFINRGARTVSANGVTVRPGTIETIVGKGSSGAERAGKRATGSEFSGSDSMAIDPKGNLYMVDKIARKVQKVDSKGTISTFAGEAAPPPLDQCCKNPSAVAADAYGNIYLSDIEPGVGLENLHIPKPRVWVINQSKRVVTLRGIQVPAGGVEPVAGSGTFGFGGDGGRATDAELSFPTGLFLDRTGSLFIVEEGNRDSTGYAGDIRKVDAAGVITLVAGNGLGGFNGDGQKARLTSLDPSDAAVLNRCGDLVIADKINGRIRRLISDRPCSRN